MLFEKKKKRTKAWFTQSWCLLIKSTIGNCCSCCRCRGGQYNNNNNNCYWSFILSIKLPFLKTGERWTFSFQNYKMAATSCYIHIYFFVILACARVLLWWLAIALEQMWPAGEVYFRPVMYSKPPRKPRVELIFYSGLQFFGFSSSRVCWIRFSTWESFNGFHLWGSPISISLAWLLCVTLEIEFRRKRGVGMRTMGPGLRCHLVPPPMCIIFYGGWIWANYHETRTTTTNCRVSFIDFYLVFPTNFRIVFLRHKNTVI